MSHLPLLAVRAGGQVPAPRIGSASRPNPDLFTEQEQVDPAIVDEEAAERQEDQAWVQAWLEEDVDPRDWVAMARVSFIRAMQAVLTSDLRPPGSEQEFREDLLALMDEALEVFQNRNALVRVSDAIMEAMPPEFESERALAESVLARWQRGDVEDQRGAQRQRFGAAFRAKLKARVPSAKRSGLRRKGAGVGTGDFDEMRGALGNIRASPRAGARIDAPLKRKQGAEAEAALEQLKTDLEAMLLRYVDSKAQIDQLKADVAAALQRARTAGAAALEVYMRAVVTLVAAPDSGTKLAMSQEVGQWYASAM
ncbi:MAG: hypothetical protein ACKVI4_17885 [Actinomycetales bacterium]|tara:strand:+ start:551 stop:1480 length:930 start_codon:yes stop_codon:yes gene_type:complete